MTTAQTSREGLKNNALLLKKSAKKPNRSAPATAPISNIDEMYPF